MTLAAQPQTVTLRGELVSPSPARLQDLTVELLPSSGGGMPARATVTPSGGFEFSNLAEGSFIARVVTVRGAVVVQQSVDVRRLAPPLSLRIPAETDAAHPAGRISLRRLQHEPPKQAVRYHRAAEKEARRGDLAKAEELLELSLAVDPEYFEGHIRLGVTCLRTGHSQRALDLFTHAVEIDPSAPEALLGRAVSFTLLGQPAAALEPARKAVLFSETGSRLQQEAERLLQHLQPR